MNAKIEAALKKADECGKKGDVRPFFEYADEAMDLIQKEHGEGSREFCSTLSKLIGDYSKIPSNKYIDFCDTWIDDDATGSAYEAVWVAVVDRIELNGSDSPAENKAKFERKIQGLEHLAAINPRKYSDTLAKWKAARR